MNIPKFTAENSLYRSSGTYRIQSDIIVSKLDVVIPQLWCVGSGNGDFICGDGGGFWSDGPDVPRDWDAITCRRGCRRLNGPKREECLNDCD